MRCLGLLVIGLVASYGGGTPVFGTRPSLADPDVELAGSLALGDAAT